MPSNPLTPTRPAAPSVPLRPGVIAALVTTLGNLALWALTRFGLGISFQVPTPPTMAMGDFNPVFVVIASVLPALLAPAVFNLVARLAPSNPVFIFRALATVLLIASFASPFVGLAEADLATKLVLNLMHVVSFAGILYLVRPHA